MKLEEIPHECPSCRNAFVQPFVCTTCGAQKLYDATLATVTTPRDEANQKLALAVAALKEFDPYRVGYGNSLSHDALNAAWRSAKEALAQIEEGK